MLPSNVKLGDDAEINFKAIHHRFYECVRRPSRAGVQGLLRGFCGGEILVGVSATARKKCQLLMVRIYRVAVATLEREPL